MRRRSKAGFIATGILFSMVLLNLFTWASQLWLQEEVQTQQSAGKYITTLSAIDILNKTEAVKLGIVGVVIISAPQGTPTTYEVKAGEELKIPVLIQFQSYNSTIKEAIISLSPSPGEVQQEYVILDSNGNEVNRGILDISGIEVYTPSSITLKDGESVQVTLSLKIPPTIPDMSFGLSASGVKASSQSIQEPYKIATLNLFYREVVIVH